MTVPSAVSWSTVTANDTVPVECAGMSSDQLTVWVAASYDEVQVPPQPAEFAT